MDRSFSELIHPLTSLSTVVVLFLDFQPIVQARSGGKVGLAHVDVYPVLSLYIRDYYH